MSSRLEALAERRKNLVARCDRQRAELAMTFGAIERKLAVADAAVTAARRLHRHRWPVLAAGVLMVVAPGTARSWIRRAQGLLPVALLGYQLVRPPGGARRTSPAGSGD